MDSRSSTKDYLSSYHSSESEPHSELEVSIDAFGNVEPYAYEPFASDSSECGEGDDKEDTNAEERKTQQHRLVSVILVYICTL